VRTTLTIGLADHRDFGSMLSIRTKSRWKKPSARIRISISIRSISRSRISLRPKTKRPTIWS